MNSHAAPLGEADGEQFQDALLAGVSRTFALTIPQLPPALRRVVTNAYLLCRIADTIEDDPAIPPAQKERFHRWYVEALTSGEDESAFARALSQQLSDTTSPEEMALVRQADRVIRVCRGFNDANRQVLCSRITVMCRGMPRFQHENRPHGLHNLAAMDQYCYYVAGVVGQMLTELFCNHSSDVARVRDPLFDLSASFGQGLQMTNILKDVWEDHERGVCWLPRDVFAAHGYDIAAMHPHRGRDAFAAGIRDLLGVAHAHLRNALTFTLVLPTREAGMRRFCLWSLVLAVLTLQRIRRHPHYTAGAQVKVPRRTVRHAIHAANLASRSNPLIRALFAWCARGLPLSDGIVMRPAFGRPLFRAQ